ncbi:TadG family pilus assembly protein [Methylocapsa sp. D3K7]|uniref:TadG family pilus assembly protein n=1 Tax=Methylocapsa sp. D3K7 TaxID=3041435 RepID=UPI00244E6F79|nr:TadG family pilus assembly protein [Methylocapsa sp. D3K7]WGJ16407.1 TadG family pilus assembly protein [Methylocapsa sp. D3K7]
MGSFLRQLWRGEDGVVAVIAALSMVMLFGFAAISVDVANLIYVKSNLQASANVAALAGGQNIPSGTATTTAITYGAQSGQKNFFSAQTVTTTPTLKCLTALQNLNGTGLGIPCLTYGSQAAANAITVTQTAVVPTFFAGALGINSVTISATATASSKGGAPPPLNVMMILDTTQSMNTTDANCSIPGKSSPSRLNCANYGIQTLLRQLSPTVDQVGLMVFPGLTNASQVSKEYDCSSSAPTIANYTTAANAVYQIISSSTDYRTSASATSLNSSSNLTKAVSIPGVAGSSCSGLSAVGGVATYYASVITAAQTALTASHQAGQQNVIVFIGDGDANATAANVGNGNTNTSKNPAALNQCRQAITAAQSATAAGTWVYSVAYGASTSSSGSCSTDTPSISACSALQQIASVPSKFYSDNPSGCVSVNSISALSSIFQNIATSLLNAMLIPNGTT